MALFDKKKLSMTSAPKAAMSSSAPKLAASPKTTMSAPKTTMSTPKAENCSPMDLMDRGKGKKKKKGCRGLSALPKTGGNKSVRKLNKRR
jgi:hypothetical protein